MKIFSISLFFIIVLLSGCASTKVKEVKGETVVKIEKVKEYVIEKCNVPDNLCEFSGNGFIPTEKLLNCVVTQKHYLDICSGKKVLNKE